MNRSSSLCRWAMIGSAALLGLALTMTASVAGAATPSPTRVRASGTATSISVSWARPVGARSFLVTSHPSHHMCSTIRTTCVVKGLRLGKTYDFTVVARGARGPSATSRVSNRVRVDSARVYFSSTSKRDGNKIDALVSNFNASTTKANTAYLRKLSVAFSQYTTSLSLEKWPAGVKKSMAVYVSVFHALGKDTVAALSTNSAEAYATLYNATDSELIKETRVLSNLKLPQQIDAPITSSPSTSVLGNSETVHDFYGDPLAVSVTQVIDPATAGTGSGLPDSGYRFVAVDLTVDNTSSQEVDGDANDALTVTGSDGKTYSADFGIVSECSNFYSGAGIIDLHAGASASGCVVFELPTSVTVQSMSFSLSASYLDTAEWTN
ncbi:MAG: DUF4352 domain-containing protein [Acidimicrobiales bacterium]